MTTAAQEMGEIGAKEMRNGHGCRGSNSPPTTTPVANRIIYCGSSDGTLGGSCTGVRSPLGHDACW